MRVLLTGSRGYIGTVMAPMMVEAGLDVVGVDADLYRFSTFGTWIDPITTMVGDVRDLQLSDLRGFDAVVHLAALSNDPLGDLNPELTSRSTIWRRSALPRSRRRLVSCGLCLPRHAAITVRPATSPSTRSRRSIL